MNKNIVVIDTETTWSDKVMSIGAVIADNKTYKVIDSRYYIITPEYKSGGMYSSVIKMMGTPDPVLASREEAIEDLKNWMANNNVEAIFAYNAKFDKNHLRELSGYKWCDIMRIAAYNQFNSRIPDNAECCKTGRLKTNYGVEPIYRLLSNNNSYSEKHNGWYDAVDELKIVEMLGLSIDTYEEAVI